MDTQVSPTSQILRSMGMTREDLSRHSDQMRQFLMDQQEGKSSTAPLLARSPSTEDMRSFSRSTSRHSYSRSRGNSLSTRDASPPRTPIKAEFSESPLMSRQMDTMEAVIERQQQARKERKLRKGKEREPSARRPTSPSPTLVTTRPQSRLQVTPQASRLNLLARGSTSLRRSPPPLTPQQSKYYREHTASISRIVHESTPTKLQTPTPKRNNFLRSGFSSPLPPSSPLGPVESPASSPVKPIVNLVSSPGPMGPAPDEDEYDHLPYRLPRGPYSEEKPDISYAAILGQAILSSPEHRLTLQEIYDWITIVYPHFKRGEQTWMNSIRHVLSTTVCFRKVVRDRALGRTQWAIWDEDLEVFKDGGFRKQLCSDMQKAALGTKRSRKVTDSSGGDSSKRAKRPKLESSSSSSMPAQSSSSTPQFALPHLPLYPIPHALRASTHHQHQPYYGGWIMPQFIPPASQPVRPKESIPPSASTSKEDMITPSPPEAVDGARAPVPSSASSSSVNSMPALTHNGSSSSPPLTTSDLGTEHVTQVEEEYDMFNYTHMSDDSSDEENDQVKDIPPTRMTPIQFWGRSPSEKQNVSSKPSVRLTYGLDDEESPSRNAKLSRNRNMLLEEPVSPTPTRPPRKAGGSSSEKPLRLKTPPPLESALPKTPTRKASGSRFQPSPMRTPVSYKGLHMSPSTSLAHYKSNLNPPPLLGSKGKEKEADEDATDEPTDVLRTPSRKRAAVDNPVTPQRSYTFSLMDSPFRTPGGNSSTMSPFRPGFLFDPNDSLALLDDELSRKHDESPSGFYGKHSRGTLLYESPGFTMQGSPSDRRGSFW